MQTTGDLVERLEGKRKVRSEAFYQQKKATAQLLTKAVESVTKQVRFWVEDACALACTKNLHVRARWHSTVSISRMRSDGGVGRHVTLWEALRCAAELRWLLQYHERATGYQLVT